MSHHHLIRFPITFFSFILSQLTENSPRFPNPLPLSFFHPPLSILNVNFQTKLAVFPQSFNPGEDSPSSSNKPQLRAHPSHSFQHPFFPNPTIKGTSLPFISHPGLVFSAFPFLPIPVLSKTTTPTFFNTFLGSPALSPLPPQRNLFRAPISRQRPPPWYFSCRSRFSISFLLLTCRTSQSFFLPTPFPSPLSAFHLHRMNP